MPVIFREGGFRIMIHTDDHEPSHVHVYRARGARDYAKVNLSNLSLRQSAGFSRSELRRIVGIVENHRQELQATWNAIFGVKS